MKKAILGLVAAGAAFAAVALDETPAEVEQWIEKSVRCWTNAAGRVVWDFGRDAFRNAMVVGDDGETWLGEKLTEAGDAIDRNPPGSVRAAKWPLKPDKRNTGKNAVKVPLQTSDGTPLPPVVMPFRYVETVPGTSVRRVIVARPMDMSASAFESSDERLNKVYDFCKWTVYATSFAGIYVDGDRERIPYEADAYINMLGEQAVWADGEMARRSLGWLLAHPTWPTEWKLHMPIMAHGYWMATGDTETIRAAYPRLRELLLLDRARAKDGLIARKSKNIVDWPPCERDGYDMDTGVNTVVNAFHIRALRDMSALAGAIGETADAEEFACLAEEKKAAFRETFLDFDSNLFVDGEGSKHSSIHANAIALAFGLAQGEVASRRLKVIDFIRSRGMACSTYFAQYLLEGLFKAGEGEYARKLMTAENERSWLGMMRQGATMCMESWNQNVKPNQDWNHAWSAAPLNIISRFVLGVRPIEPGAAKVLIAPKLCGMDWIRGVVPTAKGGVKVEADASRLAIETPVPAVVVWRGEMHEVEAGRHEW